MKIYGLQKLTLLDFPGETACTVFTGGCNMRCPFCHNASLVRDINTFDYMEEDEFFAFLRKRTGLLSGVAITGGEPLLCPDIIDFIKKIRDLGFKVKLDTNGTFPEKLRDILSQNLVDYVAMDIKNSMERYAETVGIKDFDTSPIEKSIDILTSSDILYEFRTTVVKELHEVCDIENIAKRIKGARSYFLQNFVDSGNLLGENLSAHDKDTLNRMMKTCLFYVPTSLRGI